MTRCATLCQTILSLTILGLAILSLTAAAPMAAQIITGPAELEAALGSAAPGTELRLAPGDYGTLRLGRNFAAGAAAVTVRSDDPARPAVFSGLSAKGAGGLVLADLVFEYTFLDGDDADRQRPFQIHDSHDITLRATVFDGDVAKGVSDTADGYGAGHGLVLRTSRDITIEDSTFRTWHRGLVVGYSDDIVLRGNDFYDMRSDGADFAAVQRVLIEANWFHDFRRPPQSKDHPDMIQFWTNKTKRPNTDITIRGNILNVGAGMPTQSIFMRNEEVDTGRKGLEMFYRNVEISQNVIINGHLHGITVGATDGLIIRNNTLIRNLGAMGKGKDKKPALHTPSIRVAGNAVGVVITDNIVGKIAPDLRKTPKPAWKVAGNLFIQDSALLKPGFYGRVFELAPPGGQAALIPFVYRADGPAGTGTVGAAMLQPGAVIKSPKRAVP